MLEYNGEAIRSGLNGAAIGRRNSVACGGKEIRMWRDFCCRSIPICNCFRRPVQLSCHRASSPANRGQGRQCRWQWRQQ
ncbi:hypothetical protein V6N12_042608 [Hibiscus sabdariffa]|uniref:Uncharacterized protein n=1 Tax=Hibiscus sabdariffa TaxID=183260 RepID=A0ABR2EFA2_9ROSI